MGEDHTGRPGPNERSVTVSEAAEALGITAEAVRMRIKRGTLRSEKRAGRVYVLLGSRPTTEQTTEQTPDRTAELIATLREQLEAERQAHAEARRLLMAALERIPPQLEAPGSPETAAEEPLEPTPSEPSRRAQEGSETRPEERSWWRRVFGGE